MQVRRLEAEGLTARQAEAITQLIAEVLHDSLDSVAHTFVSKPDLNKSEMVAEAALVKLKAEVQSTLDLKFAALQREVEGLKIGVDKVKSEIRYEVDKVTAGQRLDLNLEKGRVKEEMNVQLQEMNILSNKLDKEINNLKTQLEAAKFEIIRYCIGTLVSISALGLVQCAARGAAGMVFISLLEPSRDDAKRCCQLTRSLPLNYPSQLVGVTRGGVGAVTRAVSAWQGGQHGGEAGLAEEQLGSSSSSSSSRIRSDKVGSSSSGSIDDYKSDGSSSSRRRGGVGGREWWRVDGGAFRCMHRCEKVGRGDTAFRHCQQLVGTWRHFNLGWTWALSVPPPSTHPSKTTITTSTRSPPPPPPSPRLASVGDTVCVAARSLFLTPPWTMNPLRVIFSDTSPPLPAPPLTPSSSTPTRSHPTATTITLSSSSPTASPESARSMGTAPPGISLTAAYSVGSGTVQGHFLEGEERFLVGMDGNKDVWFEILSISRPANPLALAFSPLARFMQRRFAEDAMGSVRGLLQNETAILEGK
ncbi:unnamed protein product [Closterium sp. Naga37s-1]|nr:unnamed protein product [Closterium sp. Naga37s-1]